MRSIPDLGTEGEFGEGEELLYSLTLGPTEVKHTASDLGRCGEVLGEVDYVSVGKHFLNPVVLIGFV